MFLYKWTWTTHLSVWAHDLSEYSIHNNVTICCVSEQKLNFEHIFFIRVA